MKNKLFVYCNQNMTRARDINEIIAYSVNKQKYMRYLITRNYHSTIPLHFESITDTQHFMPITRCLTCVYGLRMALSKCKSSHKYKEYQNGT